MPNVIRKSYDVEDFLRWHVHDSFKVLNLGSSGNGRAGWLNVDIQRKPGVNLVADAHDLHMIKDHSFDVVICSAMLQYCHSPKVVAAEIHRVLKTDGLVYVDVPFVQPYCPDGPDLWRFTEKGLGLIFQDFDIVQAGVSIPGSSSLLFYAQDLPIHPYVKTALQFALWPLKWVVYGDRPEVAGGLYLIGRKG